ncbi:hypothetical protein Tco_1504490 [Tanacetum coccineum]
MNKLSWTVFEKEEKRRLHKRGYQSDGEIGALDEKQSSVHLTTTQTRYLIADFCCQKTVGWPKFKKLMNVRCDRKSVEMNSINFLFGRGRLLRAHQTPDEISDPLMNGYVRIMLSLIGDTDNLEAVS